MPDWLVSPAYGPDLTFGPIAINEGALCIECKACGRRTALTKKNCEHIWRGNKRLVRSVKFRCQNRSCGSDQARLYNAHTEEEATMWLDAVRPHSGAMEGLSAASNSAARRRQSSAARRHLVTRSGVLAFSALSRQRAASAR